MEIIIHWIASIWRRITSKKIKTFLFLLIFEMMYVFEMNKIDYFESKQIFIGSEGQDYFWLKIRLYKSIIISYLMLKIKLYDFQFIWQYFIIDRSQWIKAYRIFYMHVYLLSIKINLQHIILGSRNAISTNLQDNHI